MNRKNEQMVRLVAIEKRFDEGGHERVAVRLASLTAHRGELHLLLGPSGSGKTTLLTLIAGLQPPTAGQVCLFGRDLKKYTASGLQRLRAREIGFVFQDSKLIDSLSVLGNIVLVGRFAGRSRAEATARANDLLERFDLGYLRGRMPQRLSQGEKQRVAVLRAIANDATLILADEPTASLESAQGALVIRLLRDYAQERGGCVVVASHDLRLIAYADRIWRLADGCLQRTHPGTREAMAA